MEDEPDVADIIRRAGRSASWSPAVVARRRRPPSSATAARRFWRSPGEEYDLLVLDVGLPDLDGFEVCRQARSRGSRTPVLLLTARNGLRHAKTRSPRPGLIDAPAHVRVGAASTVIGKGDLTQEPLPTEELRAAVGLRTA